MTEVKRIIAEEYQKNFGSPSITVRLQGDEKNTKLPTVLDIFVWYPDEKSDLCTFATCGMAEAEIINSEKRAELLFAIKGKPSKETEKKILEFLAQLTLYPFLNNEKWTWWSSMKLTGDVPGFPGCDCIVLHPPFNENGWALIHTDLFDVNLLNVVALTTKEHEIKIQNGVRDLQNYLYEKKIQIFTPR